ncbi:uncharacterized protein LOC135693469 isoform X2 [Rhopilema esculentum]|uniref:uncharacterized protein LOC135693469 isoform X2 n=1 Tax=Rhopilema esculentum TaxID=499914 RepID=UPI0031E41E46
MTDVQLQRDKYGSLPYLSQWSRYETAQPTRNFGNTDHWSKMKHKSIDFEVHENNGVSHNFPGERLPHERKGKRDLLTYRHDIDGSMRNIGVKSFSEWIIHELKGNVPGDYNKTRSAPPKIHRTSANDRAKDGFRYWYIEKKPSTYSRWMGSKGSTLGLAG